MIPRWAERYLGIPFDRTRTKGQDCWGLVRLVLREQRGLLLPQYDDVDPYDLRAVARVMKGEPRVPHTRIALGDLQAFDVVLMWGYVQMDSGRKLTRAALHVGVAVAPKHVLHVEERMDSAIVPISHPTIAPRLVAAFRYRET